MWTMRTAPCEHRESKSQAGQGGAGRTWAVRCLLVFTFAWLVYKPTCTRSPELLISCVSKRLGLLNMVSHILGSSALRFLC